VNNNYYIFPDWPAPKRVCAVTTTRKLSINKAIDLQLSFSFIQKRLQQDLNLPASPIWLDQQHTNIVVDATTTAVFPIADAAFCNKPNIVCAILTADCLPILVCDKAATTVAAIHAGWKGIAQGIIEATISALNLDIKNLLVWLGPAIGPNKFEVGNEVRDLFIAHNKASALAFEPKDQQKWLANIYLLATQRLHAIGVTNIYGAEFCTYSQQELFHSYRRDANTDERMLSMIWLS